MIAAGTYISYTRRDYSMPSMRDSVPCHFITAIAQLILSVYVEVWGAQLVQHHLNGDLRDVK